MWNLALRSMRSWRTDSQESPACSARTRQRESANTSGRRGSSATSTGKGPSIPRNLVRRIRNGTTRPSPSLQRCRASTYRCARTVTLGSTRRWRSLPSPWFDEFCQDWVAWMAAGADPPDDFSVYVTRRSILGEQPWTGDMALLSLPGRVDVATQEQRFMTRSLGIRGLDATIVWHPGWPIRHPLVEDRRAGVLWPLPVRIDLSGLPEVHPREFGFVVEPSSLSFSEAEYARVTKVPLQVGQHHAAAALGQSAVQASGEAPN